MVTDARPSKDLRRTGDLPPCLIEAAGGAPVHGSGCEGELDLERNQRHYNHRACAGWWEDTNRSKSDPPGFRCSCTCHVTENGWPGWDRFLDQ